MTLHDKLIPDKEPFNPTIEFNYDVAFSYMTARRLERQYKGTFQKYSFVTQWLSKIVWAYVFFVLVVSSVAGEKKTQLTVNAVALIACGLYLAIYIAEILGGRFILLMVYCVILAHATFYAVADDFGLFAFAWEPDLTSDHSKDAENNTLRVLVLTLLFVIEFSLAGGFITLRYIYPWVLNRGWINIKWWFDIRRGKRSNTLTYVTVVHLWTTKRCSIEYIGGLDKENRPHGFGLWKDTAYHGENLSGLWENGIPIGPFNSREQGSGYTSEKLRIAYASIRGEQGTNKMDAFPKFTPLKWGVASVECSVAGAFFSFLPSVYHFFGESSTEERPTSAAGCLPMLRTPLDGVFYRDVEDHSASERSKCQNYKESLVPVASNPRQTYRETKEALVYIHGINTSLDSALCSIAQIMSLGDYPGRIHPFVFSWPSGSVPLLFFNQSLRAASDDRCLKGLRDFFSSLVDAGYTKVNVVTHSMGTRCFLNCLEGNHLRDLIQTSTDHTPPTTFESITFCSPEFPLPRFVEADGTFDVLKQYCSVITLYGDSRDWALFGSEIILATKWCTRMPSLGRSIGKHIRNASYPLPQECVIGAPPNTFDSSFENKDLNYAQVNQVAGIPDVAGFAFSNSTSSSSTQKQSASYATTTNVPPPLTDMLVDTITPPLSTPLQSPPPFYGTAVAPLSYGFQPNMTTCVQSNGSDVDGPPIVKIYLDMDVIDTSFVDVNTGIRHSYYRLNISIVDDIREIVLHKRRARARPGLMQQKGNVFIFLAAPSNVGAAAM